MNDRLRVGTRRSLLARTQTETVVARLARRARGTRFQVVPLDASGDRNRSPGGSPDFTDRLDRALVDGEVDLAVHSAKDLPIRLDPRLVLAATPARADPRDCLIVRRGARRAPLARGTRIGSSSPRRRAQLLRWRPDLRVVEIRGNVDSRIRFVRDGRVDAVIVAVAGVTRLGRVAEIDRILPTRAFVPAPAQGALAILTRADDPATTAIARRIDHRSTHACIDAERAFAAGLGGDCRLPLGALATRRRGTVTLIGEVLTADGRTSLRQRLESPTRSAAQLGARLSRTMTQAGALGLLDRAGR